MAFHKETIGNCELYLGDCREIVPMLGPVDAVVTSPPYLSQRMYGGMDDWSALVPVALALVPRHATTQFLVNLGLVYRDGECIEYWQEMISTLRQQGLRLYGWYVWDKGSGLPGASNGRLASSHEWVFHLNQKAGAVHKWVPTQQQPRPGGTVMGLRRANGYRPPVCSPQKIGQARKIPDSVLRIQRYIQRGGIEYAHPAMNPLALPEHLIQTFTGVQAIVCDPFMGSGTTGIACVELQRSFIGIEIEPRYFDIACQRITEAQRQGVLFPAPAVAEQLRLVEASA